MECFFLYYSFHFQVPLWHFLLVFCGPWLVVAQPIFPVNIYLRFWYYFGNYFQSNTPKFQIRRGGGGVPRIYQYDIPTNLSPIFRVLRIFLLRDITFLVRRHEKLLINSLFHSEPTPFPLSPWNRSTLSATYCKIWSKNHTQKLFFHPHIVDFNA